MKPMLLAIVVLSVCACGSVSVNVSGDTLSGSITYTPKTNNHADCNTMSITGRSRTQSFTMTRAPAG